MSLYLERYAYYQHSLIEDTPSENLYLSIVIPCFNEPNIGYTLESLSNCTRPEKGVEVIIVVNNSESASNEIIQQNQKSIEEIKEFKIDNPTLAVHILEELKLPKKHAGVGLARKIGMDEAVRRNPNGIIVCLDADSLVEPNYLVEIEQHFEQSNKTLGCGINFEHPLQGELGEVVYDGIVSYELHLRYFINVQKWAGHPHAYQTIGSSMAVRSSTYEKVGGMPKKQAGEDFYFLQKVIQLGNFSEIKSTKVIPSPRVSDRVPFGTGKAVGDYLESNKESLTYNFNTFVDLKAGITNLENLYKGNFDKLPQSLTSFWALGGFDEIKNIIKRSPNFNVFKKNFFNWFNAFQVMKYVHFARDNFHHNQPLIKMCNQFLGINFKSEKELLLHFRELDLRT